jgi:hypothetical protein
MNENDKVGYRKPPRHGQFKKGRSGNPRGRPKGSRNLATVLADIIAEPVTITENGQRRSISKLEAAAKQLVNRAATGDPRAAQQLFSLVQWVEGRSEALTPTTEWLSEADRDVIATIYARLPPLKDEQA